jgi:membrane fusion protein, multidrug efflux system
VGVTRRIVLPTVRLILLAAIAASLMKLAFGGGSEAPVADRLEPSVELTDPQIPVERATITNTVSINAVIRADAPVEVKATSAGEVSVILAEVGTSVEAGDPLLEVIYDEEVAPIAAPADDDGESPPPAPQSRRVYRTITASVDGTVTGYEVLPGQAVSIGEHVASMETGLFVATGSITPEQQYRLVDAPSEARLSPQGGQAPFKCKKLTIGVADDGDAGSSAGFDPFSGQSSGGGTGVTCAVPAKKKVFDGIPATMEITAGSAEDVLVVPVTAVQGSFETGIVWAIGADGSAEEIEVELGLTDGEFVEIVSGLDEGETVMEFIPVSEVGDLDEMRGH